MLLVVNPLVPVMQILADLISGCVNGLNTSTNFENKNKMIVGNESHWK